MKAIYSICIALVAAALLAGCNKSNESGANTAVSTPAENFAALKQAVQDFNKQEGHYPKTLDELAPKYIAKIPDAPSGFKYSYDATTGEVKLTR
jgi:hypothetical protein